MAAKLDWGHYAPPRASFPLRVLIAMGLARGKVRKMILRKWKDCFGPMVDLEVSGIKFRLNLHDNVTDGRILTSLKRYDRLELQMLENACKDDGLFIDLGANTGLYTLTLAMAGSRVIAIEPNPKTIARLNFNVSINDFSNRVTIIPFGVGEKGEFELISTGDLGSATLSQKVSSKNESVTVSVFPLLELLVENKVEKLDGIKIDIEGMEDRALLPFFRLAPPALWPRCLVIEHCNRQLWKHDVIQSMRKNGYKTVCKNRSNTILEKTKLHSTPWSCQ